MSDPKNKIATMLLEFENSIQSDPILKNILDRAKNGNARRMSDIVLGIFNGEAALKFDNITDEEFETLTDSIIEFAEEFFSDTHEHPKLKGFGEFLNRQCSVQNEYATDEHIIYSLFNKRNHTGMEIKSEDIVKMTDADLIELIIEETFIYDGDEATGCSGLPMAWDDSRGFIMIDLGYVCDCADKYTQISETEYIDNMSSPEIEQITKDGQFFEKNSRYEDQAGYTPIVMNHKTREVYFSLQGDLKKLMSPATYEGNMAEHLEMMAD